MRCLIIALLLPVLSFAQAKNDSKITVVATDTTNLLSRTAMALIDRGFNLNQKDVDLRYLVTEEKPVDRVASMKARVVIKGDSVIITGGYALDIKLSGYGRRERTFEPIINKGSKGSTLRMAWDELMAIANAIPGEKIYSK